MDEIVKRLHEKRSIEKAKQIMEYAGYNVTKKVNESEEDDEYEEMLNKMKSNSTYKKIDKLCNKYGYQLYNAIARTRSDGKKNIDITLNAPRGTYHADIYYTKPTFEGTDYKFEIQTTAYGALSAEEYEKFLKGCQDSYNLITELGKLDMTTLYDSSEDKKED